MAYTVHTDADRRALLEVVGLPDVDALFAAIPPQLRIRGLDLPPGLSEPEARARVEELASLDRPAGPASFLGAGCYRHFVPAAVRALISRSEFATAYTPYQPEVSQGTLAAHLRVPDLRLRADRAWTWRTPRSTTGRRPWPKRPSWPCALTHRETDRRVGRGASRGPAGGAPPTRAGPVSPSSALARSTPPAGARPSVARRRRSPAPAPSWCSNPTTSASSRTWSLWRQPRTPPARCSWSR